MPDNPVCATEHELREWTKASRSIERKCGGKAHQHEVRVALILLEFLTPPSASTTLRWCPALSIERRLAKIVPFISNGTQMDY
jgi:hypothetical protein